MNFWKEEKKFKIYFLAPPSLPQQSLVVKKKKKEKKIAFIWFPLLLPKKKNLSG